MTLSRRWTTSRAPRRLAKSFPTTQVLTADGVISLIGCLLGNPFINAVYIGHPGWKAMGGRIGYSAATGVMVLVLTWLGIVALVSSLIPVVAILPILLYIGMLIGSQAFQETPRSHAPAIILAMIPQIAAWGKTMIDGALGAAGTNAATVGFDKLGNTGVLYKGLETLGGGATLAGIILGAVTVFITERELEKAAAFALAGSVLTFFGLIHAEDLGIGQSPVVSLSYLGIAVMLYCFAKFAHVAPAAIEFAWPWRNERAAGGIGAIDVPARRATLALPRPPRVDGWRGACRR